MHSLAELQWKENNQKEVIKVKLKQKFLDEFEDLDFYNEAQIEQDLEDDEIDGLEEGFMRGYLE